MRGIAVIVAVIASFALIVPRADAHFCSNPVSVEAGKASTITVGVAAETVPVTAVVIDIPAALRVDDVPAVKGWTITRAGSAIRLTGGRIEAYGCAYFSIKGMVADPSAGTLKLPITTTDTDGTVVHYRGSNEADPYVAQLVSVFGHLPSKTTPSSVLYAQPEGRGRADLPSPLIVGAGIVAIGAVLVVRRSVRARQDTHVRAAQRKTSVSASQRRRRR